MESNDNKGETLTVGLSAQHVRLMLAALRVALPHMSASELRVAAELFERFDVNAAEKQNGGGGKEEGAR